MEKITYLNYNNSEIEDAKNLIHQYTGSVANNNLLFKEGYKAFYDQDYSYLSLKRSHLVECECNAAKFTASALTGSNFQFTKFTDCDFSGASLDFCLFYDCDITASAPQYAISNITLGNSSLVSCRLNHITISKSTISNGLFECSCLDECSFEYSSFENTVFRKCHFKNMEFRNLNLEFVEFMQDTFENVILPFAQIPYTIGLLESIQEYPEKISITSINGDRHISADQYWQLLPRLVPYYLSEQEYFPAANIYIAFKEYEKAFEAIALGIKKASIEKNFRMLKYLCKLSIISGWCDRNKIIRLYNAVNDIHNFEPLSNFERHNYYMQLGDFRKILLFNNDLKPTLNFQIQTNILPNEPEKIAILIDCIDKIINSVKTDGIISTIELRHESPYILFAIIIGSVAVLKIISEGINYVCTPIKDIQEIIMNQQQILLNSQEISINQDKLEEIRLAVEDCQESLQENQISLNGNFYFTNIDFAEDQNHINN